MKGDTGQKCTIRGIPVPLFDSLPGFQYLFSMRKASVDSTPLLDFDHRKGPIPIVEASYRAAARYFGINESAVFVMKQVHGNDIAVIRDIPDRGAVRAAIEVDAVITDVSGLALSVLTADCLPILMVDPVRGIVAAVHAGWRSAFLGIIARVLGTMEEVFGTNPSDIYAALGPAIGRCCFEVGPEVVAAARESFPYADDYIDAAADKKGMLDLSGLNCRVLVEQGVQRGRIYVIDLCTRCHNELFYSYRREGPDTGRMLAAVMKVGRSGDRFSR